MDDSGSRRMVYVTPELRALGSFTYLTLGVGGSCTDGGGRNSTQHGGGSIGGIGEVSCGPGPSQKPHAGR